MIFEWLASQRRMRAAFERWADSFLVDPNVLEHVKGKSMMLAAGPWRIDQSADIALNP